MGIRCGPAPEHPAVQVECGGEDLFLPAEKRQELSKLIAKMTVMLDEQREKILELEGDKLKLMVEKDRLEEENLILKDRLLQIEFGGDDEPVKPPRPPEPPPAPMGELIRE